MQLILPHLAMRQSRLAHFPTLKMWNIFSVNEFLNLLFNLRTGNWKHFATFTKHWPSHKPSSSVTRDEKSTGSRSKCMARTSLCPPCTAIWIRKSVKWSCASFARALRVSLSLLICLLVALTCSRCRLSLTTTCPITVRTTFTGWTGFFTINLGC